MQEHLLRRKKKKTPLANQLNTRNQLEEFESCGGLRVTIATINLKPRPPPNYINSNPYIVGLAEGKGSRFPGKKAHKMADFQQQKQGKQ